MDFIQFNDPCILTDYGINIHVVEICIKVKYIKWNRALTLFNWYTLSIDYDNLNNYSIILSNTISLIIFYSNYNIQFTYDIMM